MRRKSTDSPYKSGEWSKADLDSYCPNSKPIPLLWGIAAMIAIAVLAHMIVRFAGWLGSR